MTGGTSEDGRVGAAQRKSAGLDFPTHVSDDQGCDCKQRLQSRPPRPGPVHITLGVPVIGRKANKEKQ